MQQWQAGKSNSKEAQHGGGSIGALDIRVQGLIISRAGWALRRWQQCASVGASRAGGRQRRPHRGDQPGPGNGAAKGSCGGAGAGAAAGVKKEEGVKGWAKALKGTKPEAASRAFSVAEDEVRSMAEGAWAPSMGVPAALPAALAGLGGVPKPGLAKRGVPEPPAAGHSKAEAKAEVLGPPKALCCASRGLPAGGGSGWKPEGRWAMGAAGGQGAQQGALKSKPPRPHRRHSTAAPT